MVKSCVAAQFSKDWWRKLMLQLFHPKLHMFLMCVWPWVWIHWSTTLLLKLLYRNMMRLPSICQTSAGPSCGILPGVTQVLLAWEVLCVPCRAGTDTSVLWAEENLYFFMKIVRLTWRWSFYWSRNKGVFQGALWSHWGSAFPHAGEGLLLQFWEGFSFRVEDHLLNISIVCMSTMNEHFSVLHCAEMTESSQKMLALFTNRKLSLQVFVLTQWLIDLLYPTPRCCHSFWIQLKMYEESIANEFHRNYVHWVIDL